MTHTNSLHSKEIAEQHKCVIIGSGPAGYTAAIYAARANLNPVLYEGLQPGGQLTITTDVENFPGYPTGVTGTELMNDIRSQAERFGTDVRRGFATAVDFSGDEKLIEIDGTTVIAAKTVIVATGATAKYLGLPSELQYKGLGVSACATCDGFFYRKQTVAVVGGGDTAAEEAVYLAGLASKVYLIVRKKHLRASKAMQHKVQKTENIEILFEHEVQEVLGDEQGVNALRLIKEGEEEYTISVTGLFLAIGHHPNTEIFAGQLNLDEAGYIITQPGSSHTNCQGVFACGDVQDPHYRQAITAAASGCIAALDVERFLS
jgi:thioredoxin reductase (NADPH)